jgi:hypothetical protein
LRLGCSPPRSRIVETAGISLPDGGLSLLGLGSILFRGLGHVIPAARNKRHATRAIAAAGKRYDATKLVSHTAAIRIAMTKYLRAAANANCLTYPSL